MKRYHLEIPFRFFILTFLWSWLLWLPCVLEGQGLLALPGALSGVLTFAGVFGPAFGALVSVATLDGKHGLRKFVKSFFSVRFGWKAWCLPPLILLCISVIAWITPEFFGHARAPIGLDIGILLFPLFWLFMVLLGGGQEEIGWRGYALPYIEKAFGTLYGNLILGVIWALWHIPLWFFPEDSMAPQAYMFFGGFLLLTIGESYFYSWALKSSGNRPLVAMIIHGTANAIGTSFPLVIHDADAVQIRFWIWTALTFLVGMVFMLILRRMELNGVSAGDTRNA